MVVVALQKGNVGGDDSKEFATELEQAVTQGQ